MRGLCEDTVFDTRYTFTTVGGGPAYLGYHGSIIQYRPEENRSQLGLV